jgi:peptide methionine sulfoxide reductase MsrB
MEKVTRTDADWREKLIPEEYQVLRQSRTEAPSTGPDAGADAGPELIA